ncbi:MAG: hypothetical protein WD490_07665 [Opitutales bacterium]
MENSTSAQKRLIDKEENASKVAPWLLDLNGDKQSPFSGMDLDHYLSLVEWTVQNIREDKRGYIPVHLKPVLERFDLDTHKWIGTSRGTEAFFTG